MLRFKCLKKGNPWFVWRLRAGHEVQTKKTKQNTFFLMHYITFAKK